VSTRRALLLVALLGLPFCSSSASLTGSVSAIFPLAFNQSAIFVNSQSFELDYYLVNAGSEDLVIELLVDLTGIDFQPGVSIDLSTDVAPGLPRATVVHQASLQPIEVMPPISSGTLSLSSGGAPGEFTTGSFQLAFSATVSALGNGRTLSGNFAATAQSAAFPVTDGGIPGEVCTNGSCCITPCGGGCCGAGESCLDGGCCAQPCGGECCGANTVCYTDSTGAQSCIPSCTSTVSCTAIGLTCCVQLPGGVNGCIPTADVTAQTACICVTPTECPSGCCAPSVIVGPYTPITPLVCKNDDGAIYDCCNTVACQAGQGCCSSSPNGSNVCVTQCTVDGGECGTASCLNAISGWNPGATCNAAEMVCGP